MEKLRPADIDKDIPQNWEAVRDHPVQSYSLDLECIFEWILALAIFEQQPSGAPRKAPRTPFATKAFSTASELGAKF